MNINCRIDNIRHLIDLKARQATVAYIRERVERRWRE